MAQNFEATHEKLSHFFLGQEESYHGEVITCAREVVKHVQTWIVFRFCSPCPFRRSVILLSKTRCWKGWDTLKCDHLTYRSFSSGSSECGNISAWLGQAQKINASSLQSIGSQTSIWIGCLLYSSSIIFSAPSVQKRYTSSSHNRATSTPVCRPYFSNLSTVLSISWPLHPHGSDRYRSPHVPIPI